MTKEKSRSFWRAGGFSMGGSDTNITTSILPSIETTTTPQNAELIVAPDLFRQLSSIQLEARDLYNRGLNVIPLVRPSDVKLMAQHDPHYCPDYNHPNKNKPKPPFALQEFYTSRLHLCSYECNGCALPEEARFDDLFYYANIGVMVGATSGNLVDIDCDNKESYQRVGKELASKGIFAWQYTSYRGGHYLLRVREGELANTNTGDGVEVYGNKHYAVLPPSLHPEGVIYCWESTEPRLLPPGELPQDVGIDDLAFLGAKLLRSAKRLDLFGLPPFTAYLSTNNRRILADSIAGAIVEGERNTKLTKAAYDLAANIQESLINYAEGEGVLLEAANGCGYPEQEAVAILRSAIKKRNLQRAKRKQNNQPIARAWAIAKQFASSFDWRLYGRLAQNVRSTMLACVERSRVEGDVFRASVREVQELANFGGINTAHKMLAILSSDNIAPALLQKEGAGLSGANTFSFTDKVLNNQANRACQIDTLNIPCIVNVSNSHGAKHDLISTPSDNNASFDTAKKDVFYKIGKVGLRVYDHLLLVGSEPSIAAIAKQTKQHRTSISKAVKKLMAIGLVTHNQAEQLYFAEPKTTHNLEMIAAVMGSLGKNDKRKRQHQGEREIRVNKAVYKARLYWSFITRKERAAITND